MSGFEPPMALRLLARYRAMPEKLRMISTAIIGMLIGLLSYEVVYFVNPLSPRAPTSWFIAYTVGIARQHGLHRWLTFSSRPPYWPSLGRAYLMYAGAAATGTFINWGLTGPLGLNHRFAWLVCLFATMTISLVFLKRFVFAASARAE